MSRVLSVTMVVAFFWLPPLWVEVAAETEPESEATVPELTIEVEVETERPAKVEVVEAEQVEQMPAVQNFADAVVRLPGTQTIYGCLMNSPRLSFRGSNYTWLQMMVEGMNLNPIGSCTLQRVPWRSLSEIEVVRGPAPPKYPGNTLAGVVSMTMRDGDKYPGAEFVLSGGNYGSQTYDVLAGGGDQETNYFLAFNRTRSDGWMPKDHVTDLSDLSFKLNFTLDPESQLTFAAAYLHGEKQGFRPLGPNPFDVWEHRWLNLSRPAASLTYRRKTGPRSDILLRTSPVKITYDQQFQKWNAAQGAAVPMVLRRDYRLWRHEFQHNLALAPESVFTWGLWYQHDRDRQTKPNPAPTLGAWGKRTQTSKGAYAQSTLRTGKGVVSTLGLRYDDVSPGKGTFIPFASCRVDLDPRSTLRLAITRNKRFPMLDELYGVGVNVGNPNLKPHSAWTYQLDWEQELPDEGKVTASLFRVDHRDMIAVDPNYVYRNIGKARVQGLELSYEGRLEAGTWWANYTLLDAKDLTKDRPLVPAYRTAPPKHMFKVGATLKDRQGITWSPEVLYYSRRRTDVDTPTFVGDPWNVTVPTSVPAFAILNLKVSKPVGKQLTANLSVENLLDKDYEEMVFYPRAGRWVNLGVSRKF